MPLKKGLDTISEKATCLARLGNRLSEDEIQIIEALRDLKKHGWGALHVVVKKGEVIMVSPTLDMKLSK